MTVDNIKFGRSNIGSTEEVHDQNVVFWLLDDIELVDWTNTILLFERLWFCEDIHHSSILKLAIEKAIQKSTNANSSSKLFQDDSNYEKNQFLGFVSSHKKGILLTSVHIHSLLDFHTDLQKNTMGACCNSFFVFVKGLFQIWIS